MSVHAVACVCVCMCVCVFICLCVCVHMRAHILLEQTCIETEQVSVNELYRR